MKANATTTTALCVINTKENRAAKAHARHIIDTTGTWTSTPKGIRPPIHRMNATQIQTTASAAAYIAIRARHASAGDLPILRQLQDAAAQDAIWATLPDLAAEALKARAEHANYTEQAEALDTIAKRASTDPSTAKRAAQLAKTAKAKAEQAKASYQAIEAKAEKLRASDRADIVQAAALALIERADFAAACHAAGKAIAQTASPDALTSTRTRRTEITEAEAQKIEARAEARTTSDGRISEYITRTGSKGYVTIERKAGKVYKVAHEMTDAPYISYDQWASGEAVEGLANNGGINAITGQTEAEQIAAFLSRSGLTDKEQRITRKAADLTAAKAGQAAKNAYIESVYPAGAKRITASKWARIIKAGDNVALAAQWENAFQREGIYSKSNRSTIKGRIKAKLEAAASTPEPDTPEEKTERKAKAWERMQGNRRRAYHIDRTKRPDLIAWTERTSTSAPGYITWTTHDTLTAWAADIERRAAHPDTSAKPIGYDIRVCLYILDTYARATSTLALPAMGQSTASRKEQERRARAASRHPNTSPDTITTPENPKAAEERRRAAQWERYWSHNPKPQPKPEPQTDPSRAARLAALNTPEQCAARLAAMRAAKR